MPAIGAFYLSFHVTWLVSLPLSLQQFNTSIVFPFNSTILQQLSKSMSYVISSNGQAGLTYKQVGFLSWHFLGRIQMVPPKRYHGDYPNIYREVVLR